MSNIISTQKFEPNNEDKFLFDTNVLMRLFYTNGDYGEEVVKQYNNIFTYIFTKHSKIILTDFILSEFATAFISEEQNRIYKDKSKETLKNKFRPSAEYKAVINEIKAIIEKQLLPYSDLVRNDYFCKKNILFALDNIDKMEFNDHMCCSCANEKFYIVTHDVDMGSIIKNPSYNINIITYNIKLLMMKP